MRRVAARGLHRQLDQLARGRDFLSDVDDGQAAQTQDHPGNAEPVGEAQIIPVRLLVRQAEQQQQHQHGTNRHVDEECIMPAEVLGQPAAQQRAHHRTQDDGDSEQGHADWLLPGRQTGGDDSHGGWDQRATHQSLAGPANDHGGEVSGNSAQHRKGGEHHDGDQQQRAQA